MSSRLGLLELAARYRLNSERRAQLWRLAGMDEPPGDINNRARRALGLLGAALAGFGLICWIAANWSGLGRLGHFALLQSVVFAMFGGAALLPRARTALTLAALLALGGLLAYFGQTYQTGADPWQLFAFWSLLGLPLCLAARHDAIWSVWTLIASIAIARWDFVHLSVGWLWFLRHANAWALHFALALLLSGRALRLPGAGRWAFGTSVILGTISIGWTALGGLLHDSIESHFWLAVLIFGAAAALLASRRFFDIFALSVVSLGLNVLIVVALARIIFELGGWDLHPGKFLLLGLVAAVNLAGTVRYILLLSSKYRAGANA